MTTVMYNGYGGGTVIHTNDDDCDDYHDCDEDDDCNHRGRRNRRNRGCWP